MLRLVDSGLMRIFRVLLLSLLALMPARAASQEGGSDKPPGVSAVQVLEAIRESQQHLAQELKGRLRTSRKSYPFSLTAKAGAISWHFSEPDQTITLRMSDDGARLEESSNGKNRKVTSAKWTAPLHDSDMTYEDLSMGFLYWRTAKIDGEQSILMQKCWIIHAEPPKGANSQYTHVRLWVSQGGLALMQVEAYAGKQLARRFKVVSAQKTDEGAWLLKQMRIESFLETSKDRTPSYLEIESPDKKQG